MRDLVTGASGFVGRHLARALAAQGRGVRATVHRRPLSAELIAMGVEPVTANLTDAASLTSALRGVDRVFHCAALVGDWGRPQDFRAANVDGVGHLLTGMRAAGVRRLLHVSTTDVYGFPPEPVDEDAPLRRRGWPYGDSKIEGEEKVWRAADDLEVTVLRPANVYGVGSESFVGEIAELLRRRQMLHLGDPGVPAGLCHVDNLVDCMLLAAEHPAARGRAYNVTDDSRVSWRTFTDALADALDLPRPRVHLPRAWAYPAGWCLERLHGAARSSRRPLLTRMAVELFTCDQSFPVHRARRELGWVPRRDFASALPELVAWLRGRSHVGVA